MRWIRYLYWSQAQQLRLGNVNNFCSQPPSEFFCVLKCDQTVAIIESYTMISISMEFRRKEKWYRAGREIELHYGLGTFACDNDIVMKCQRCLIYEMVNGVVWLNWWICFYIYSTWEGAKIFPLKRKKKKKGRKTFNFVNVTYCGCLLFTLSRIRPRAAREVASEHLKPEPHW